MSYSPRASLLKISYWPSIRRSSATSRASRSVRHPTIPRGQAGSLPSNLDEDLLPVQPEADQPEHEERRGRPDERAIRPVEEVLAEVDTQRRGNIRLHELRHQVDGDRVHANNDQGERPPAIPGQVDYGVECREHQARPA